MPVRSRSRCSSAQDHVLAVLAQLAQLGDARVVLGAKDAALARAQRRLVDQRRARARRTVPRSTSSGDQRRERVVGAARRRGSRAASRSSRRARRLSRIAPRSRGVATRQRGARRQPFEVGDVRELAAAARSRSGASREQRLDAIVPAADARDVGQRREQAPCATGARPSRVLVDVEQRAAASPCARRRAC